MRGMLGGAAGWRLQHILVLGFVLIATFAIAVGALLTNSVINSYLEGAQHDRVGRDLDLADAFYNNKLNDIASSTRRIASAPRVRHNLEAAARDDVSAIEALGEEVGNELSSLQSGTRRFVVVTDAQGTGIAGRVAADDAGWEIATGTIWLDLPVVRSVLSNLKPADSTEVMPAEHLGWLGLEEQARIALIDTPKAALEPFDRREGTAGLVLVSAAPILNETGKSMGAVLVGHLFNKDFTLVDRIKEVAGVDTATIFFGDLRVSTNVLDEAGQRAIGTRVSQEVFDQVLVNEEEFTGEAFVVNQNYITRYKPLYDHQGSVVGILYVGAKQAVFQRLVDSFRDRVVLIAGATVLLAILIAIPLARFISRPLTGLAAATRRVAEGDWSVRVPSGGPREMRILAETFNTMVETLNETQGQLIQQEKLASVGQLAAGVAHEINNPLGSVLLYADILRKETPEEDEQQREDLEMIISEANRCKVIVNDLLNFSRQNEVLAQDTDLNALLQSLAEDRRKLEVFEQVDVVLDLDPDLMPIQADPHQLRQVFLNLMDNAAEAMPAGGTLSLRTRSGPASGFVTAQVRDTGVGIPEEHMRKIFTPFFTTKPIGKGTGLGLAIIYGIVKMHRGQIAVTSEPGRGTTFTITLRETLPSQAESLGRSFIVP